MTSLSTTAQAIAGSAILGDHDAKNWCPTLTDFELTALFEFALLVGPGFMNVA